MDSVSNWIKSRPRLNAEKTKLMWCASARRLSQLPRCRITVAGASVEPVSVVRDLGVYIDSDLGAATHVRTIEPCRTVLQHCNSFLICVFTSTTTDFVLSWSRPSTLSSIMATSCLLGFLPISNDVCRPYSTPQLAWYFDFVAMTTCLMPWRYCTGCVCQNGSTFNWHRVLNGMTPPYLIQLVPDLYLACQVVAVCDRRSRCRLQLHVPLYYRLSTCSRKSLVSCRSLHLLEHSAR